jgi:phage terminase large subunit-like protein
MITMGKVDGIGLLDIPESQIVKELLTRGGLHEFIRQFWSVIEPGNEFVDNWHIGAVCEFINAIYNLEIKRGVINIPPGCMKSSIVGVFAPAWIYADNPSFKLISAGFDPSLIMRDAGKMLDIMRSDLYREIYPDTVLASDDPAKSEIWTTKRGLRLSTSIKGKGLGWHGDLFTVDDSVKASEAVQSKSVANKRVIEWYQTTAQSRKADPKKFRFLCIMQRLSEGDLPEHLLDLGFEHLCLPMRYVPNATWIRGYWSAKLDKRTQEDELLWPARFGPEEVEQQELELGTDANIAAQMQQNPGVGSGGIIDKDWFKRYDTLPENVIFVQIWDTNFKGSKETHSRVVGTLFAFTQDDFYLVDEVRGLWNFPQTEDAYIDAQKRKHWGSSYASILEAKANGQALCDNLKEKLARGTLSHILLPELREPAEGDKVYRMAQHAGKIRQGRFWLPKQGFPNLEGKDGWLREVCGFPRMILDDRVDNLSMFLEYVTKDAFSLLAWASLA